MQDSQPDVIVWPFTPSGQYSVQSGYRFLRDSSAELQRTDHDVEFWRNVWGMEVPSKIKNFVWRACKEALPTKGNLLRRKITTSALCDCCKSTDEDCAHAIFYCSNLQVIWSSDPQWSWLAALQGHNVKGIFQRAFAENRDAELLAITGWAIWNRRNQSRLKEAVCPLSHILPLSKERKAEFQNLQPIARAAQHRNHTRWKPPEAETYKVNYDGAIFAEKGRAGIGVVIRNAEGSVMASLSQQVPLPTTVAQVEAMAARKAVELALEIGFTNVIIEGDSEIIFKELNSTDPSLALQGHVIQDTKCLASSFVSHCFTHTCRQGNNVAHALARWAINTPNLTVWMEDVPPDIHYLVRADLALSD